MRYWTVISAWLCLAGTAFAAAPPDEIGVLTCSVGRVVDAAAPAQASGANEAREMLCSFKTSRGPDEHYAGLVKTVGGGMALPQNRTLLWSVRAPRGTHYTTGLLQQTYTADKSTPAGQVPPLLGEHNSLLSLYVLTEKPAGSASKEKPPAPELIIVDVELVLKTAVGRSNGRNRHAAPLSSGG